MDERGTTERDDGASVVEFTGVDGASGGPAFAPLEVAQVAAVARGSLPPERELDALRRLNAARRANRHLIDGHSPLRIEEAGWGVVLPAAVSAEWQREVLAALAPLLKRRREQMPATHPEYFQQLMGPTGYQPGEGPLDFVESRGGAIDRVKPGLLPYYLLLVGTPEQIPFEFETGLAPLHAVGRLAFEDPEDLAAYAAALVAAEERPAPARPAEATFFAPEHPGDKASMRLAQGLVGFLLEQFASQPVAKWSVQGVVGEPARKAFLTSLLGAVDGGDLVVAAGHGMAFPAGPMQRQTQGALLCQDWPGEAEWPGLNPPNHYFAAQDVPREMELLGRLVVLIACFSAGMPALNEFPLRGDHGETRAFSPSPFTAALPLALLRQGARAVIGHVERAWTLSWAPRHGAPLTGDFEMVFRRLMAGAPVGCALSPLADRAALATSHLDTVLRQERLLQGRAQFDRRIADLYLIARDARNYVVVGDPAARLPVPG